MRHLIVIGVVSVSSMALGDGVTLYANASCEGDSVELRTGAVEKDLGKLDVSSVEIHDGDAAVLLYEGEDFTKVAYVVAGKGRHDLPGDWNDKARSVRVINLKVAGHFLELMRDFSALTKDKDQQDDLRSLPPVARLEHHASKNWAQGNEGSARVERAFLDVKQNRVEVTLWVRHRHSLTRGIRAYSVPTTVKVEVNLASPGDSEANLDLGRGIKISLDDLVGAFG